MRTILSSTVLLTALLGAAPAFAQDTTGEGTEEGGIPCGCPDDGTGGQGDGGTVGDPHNISIDGAQYDFFAVGEFTIYQSPSIEIQVRGEQYGDTPYTANTAVAVKTARHRIGFYAPTDSETALVLVDGEELDLRDGKRISLDDGSTLTRNGRFYSVIDKYGQRVIAGMQTDWMDVWVKGVYTGGAKGMLGNGDGDPGNDFVTRDGQSLELPMTHAQIYDQWGESWRVDTTTTLFDYAEGEGPESYHDRSFHQSRRSYNNSRDVREGGLYADAELSCMDAGVIDPHLLDICAIEVAETGDIAFAESIASMPEPSLVVVPVDEDIDRQPLDAVETGEQPGGCSVVPVTAGLFGLGLAAMGALRRRRED